MINSGREYWPESTKKTNMDRLHNWLRDHLNQSKTLHVSQDLLNVCRLAQYWSYCQHDPHRCRLTNPGSKSKFIQKELLQHACLQSYQWTLGIQRILPRRPPSKVQDLMKTLKELDHIQLCRIRYSGYEYSRHCLLDRWKISLGGKCLVEYCFFGGNVSVENVHWEIFGGKLWGKCHILYPLIPLLFKNTANRVS